MADPVGGGLGVGAGLGPATLGSPLTPEPPAATPPLQALQKAE